MDDRTLLELAAKAMQATQHPSFMNYQTVDAVVGVCLELGSRRGAITSYWNPLTDDGAALRLAVNLRMHLDLDDKESSGARVNECVFVSVYECTGKGDALSLRNEATRRAIVRAAAAIGERL